jgi:hypothetical protein
MSIKIIFLCLLFVASHSFVIISPDVLMMAAQQVVNSIDVLKRAAVPSDYETAIAIGISEAFAGAIGGIVSRRTAEAIGDKKKDTIITKISATSAFFGTRGLTQGFCKILGVPAPLSKVIASIIASVVSEGTKAAGRSSQHHQQQGQQKQVEKLDVSEISGDITKWIAYDFLTDQNTIVVTQFLNPQISSIVFGSMAACIGLSVKEIYLIKKNKLNFSLLKNDNKEDSWRLKYTQASLEGGTLFGSYSMINNLLRNIVPEDLNEKFVFNQIVETIEKTIVEDSANF